MEIKRGYLKWFDENGILHKKPAYESPMLEDASPREQIRAEEARRLNGAASEEQDTEQSEFDAFQVAPDEVLTVAQLDDD